MKANRSSASNMDEMISRLLEIRLPEVCSQHLKQGSKADIPLYQMLLVRYGIVLIQLDVSDSSGKILQGLVEDLGVAHVHDAKGTIMWDITQGGSTGSEALARSHGSDEFRFHTDFSYEVVMPGFFGLYVIHPDTKGGGINMLVNSSVIVQNISKRTYSVLVEQPYTFRIPPEFYKGIDTIRARIIDENLNLRYRREIIAEENCNQEQMEALAELDSIISDPSKGYQLNLKKNQILFLDNRRFLHARSQIKDRKRHIKRI